MKSYFLFALAAILAGSAVASRGGHHHASHNPCNETMCEYDKIQEFVNNHDVDDECRNVSHHLLRLNQCMWKCHRSNSLPEALLSQLAAYDEALTDDCRAKDCVPILTKEEWREEHEDRSTRYMEVALETAGMRDDEKPEHLKSKACVARHNGPGRLFQRRNHHHQ